MNAHPTMTKRLGPLKLVWPTAGGRCSLKFNGPGTAAVSVAAFRTPGWMTPAQRDIYRMLATRWPRVSEPGRDSKDGSTQVECFYPGALGSFIVRIKPDGVQTRLSVLQSSDA